MSKPIKIEFIAETAQWLRDVKRVEISTEDLAEALVTTSNTSDDLERKLSKAMKDVERDVESLERAVKDLPKAADNAADDMDRDFDRMGDDAKDAGKEMGGNLAQSLGEGLGSGDISETVQEVLGEAVGNISGPLSAAVAAGAALALAVWNSFKAASDKAKEKVNEYLDITDEVTGAIDQVELIRSSLEELGGGDYGQGLRDVAQYARDTGVPVKDLVALITGQVNPATDVTYQTLKKQKQVMEEQREEADGPMTDAWYHQYDAINEVLGTTELQRDMVQDGAEAQKIWTEATKGLVDVNMDGVIDALDVAAADATTLANQTGIAVEHLLNMPNSKLIKITLDTSAIDEFSGGAWMNSNGSRWNAKYAP